MNILLINHYAGSPELGMEYRPYYLAREWQRLGHGVRIVAASCSHLRLKSPKLTGGITEEQVDGIPYAWLRTPLYDGNGVKRALNMFAFVSQLLRYSSRLTRKHKPDVVIASSTYPLDNLPARFIARRCCARLVFEVHDLWPLSLVELGNMSRRHPFIQLMQWAENFAYRSADRVVSMLPNARAHMEAHGMNARKFRYVPKAIAVEDWDSANSGLLESHSAVLSRLRASGQFIIGYTGGHGVSNALGFLLKAAKLLNGHRVAFVLVGSGAEKDKLIIQAGALDLRNLTFLPAVAKAAVPALLRRMDAFYIGWQNKAIYRFGVSPTKMFDYMMAGKPVIHSTNASNDIVAESRCGISVAPENPEAIAAAIRHLAALPTTERDEMGRRGIEYVLKHHDYRVLGRQFLAALA